MAADDAVVPDAKDWTWVLTRPCPDCGLDPVTVAGYAEQDPTRVATEPAAAAEAIADRFDAVQGGDWTRTGRRTGDGATFTVETFGRYFVHDWRHHLHDVGADG